MPPVNDDIRVMVVEDHAETRRTLAALLQGSPGFACTGAHPSAETALTRIHAERPRVILVDLELRGMSGVEFLSLCRSRFPEVELVVLTMHDEPEWFFPALEAGATGYLVKGTPPARIIEAIAEVASGGSWMSGQIARRVLRSFERPAAIVGVLATLSAREREVLESLARGMRYDEIGLQLGVSARTVNAHLQHIYRKLHVHSATAAIARLHEYRPSPLPPSSSPPAAR
ncbi:MAG: response regulator [Limisphaerales bacterium]